jgi:putative FmdB family regulatory protein
MPIYEYACGKCEHEFEVEQRITDDPVTTCPSCRSRRVKRLISQTSFVLKGSGWYSDLYASGKGKAKAKPEGKTDEASTSSGAASKSEKKGSAKDKGSAKSKGKAKGSPKAAA